MGTVFPGTAIETKTIEKGGSRTLFDGIFAAGGITLSQVSIMTGLEPYIIQNWVKRGFLSSPQKRMYSKNQFARVVIINMLHESLSLDSICKLLSYINNSLSDESDDMIGDSELYHIYIDMLSLNGGVVVDEEKIKTSAEEVAKEFVEKTSGERKRLIKVLQVMAHAHYACISRKKAEELLSCLQ